MNNLYVAFTVNEIEELVEFISNCYFDSHSRLGDNPVLVNAWVKLKSELDLVEAAHNEE